MSYSDFTLKQLRDRYGLQHRVTPLFPAPITQVNPSEILRLDLERSMRFALSSEKAKSEFVITPILKEVIVQNGFIFSLFSGILFDVKDDLTGICDYILSAQSQQVELSAPIICLVEAKNRNIDDGFGQCAAEMYAALLMNQKENANISVIYGCVTNAFDWVFLKLENNTVLISQERFSSYENLPKLLGAWQYIIDFYKSI